MDGWIALAVSILFLLVKQIGMSDVLKVNREVAMPVAS